MLQGPAHEVSAADLERLLREAENATASVAEGILGPSSISWRVNRESALFLAAGRAALLQLAHPWVAAAIAQHSRTLHDPIGRFHQTFRVMFTVVFAPLEDAIAAARHLHRRHNSIRGTLPEPTGRFVEGSAYEANDIAALRWVYATLVDSALQAYELVLPRLTQLEREQYYVESLKTAALFGIPRQCLPPDWQGFTRYFQSALQSDIVGVSSVARRLASELQAGAGLRVRPPFWYGALTTQLLPPCLRDEFRFAYEEREQLSAERAVRWLRRIYPRLPASVRFVGPYNEIQSRMRGSPSPSLATRLSNKLWIGQPSLFGPQDHASLPRR
jgi:uncharacterized protein (DUF2236 family)